MLTIALWLAAASVAIFLAMVGLLVALWRTEEGMPRSRSRTCFASGLVARTDHRLTSSKSRLGL